MFRKRSGVRRMAGAALKAKESAVDGSAAALGRDLRALRKARGFTLIELAGKLDRSVGYLSQVERGLSRIGLADLRRLAALYGLPLGWFFARQSAPAEERGYVVRGDARRTLGAAGEGLTEQLLSPDLGGAFEVFLTIIEPGVELTAPLRRDSEEAGYLIEGELELWIGARRFRLGAGDSFRFAREPFRWRNPGRVATRIVWVIAPPVY